MTHSSSIHHHWLAVKSGADRLVFWRGQKWGNFYFALQYIPFGKTCVSAHLPLGIFSASTVRCFSSNFSRNCYLTLCLYCKQLTCRLFRYSVIPFQCAGSQSRIYSSVHCTIFAFTQKLLGDNCLTLNRSQIVALNEACAQLCLCVFLCGRVCYPISLF